MSHSRCYNKHLPLLRDILNVVTQIDILYSNFEVGIDIAVTKVLVSNCIYYLS